MENALFSDVTIETEDILQNRGDENEYRVSSVFDGNSEVEISEEERPISEATVEANRKRLKSRAERGGLKKWTNGLLTSAEDKSESAKLKNNCSTSQAGKISVYTSASLDDVEAVPNSVPSDTKQSNWRSAVDVERPPGADESGPDTPQQKRSVTINFRLTEEHFCCSARESSLHLELDIANSDNSRTRFDFPSQVTCQDQAPTTQREHLTRLSVPLNSRKAFSNRSPTHEQEESVERGVPLTTQRHQFLYDTLAEMDNSRQDFNCRKSPETSNSDSDSLVDISDSADSSDQETDQLLRSNEHCTQSEKQCNNVVQVAENIGQIGDIKSEDDLEGSGIPCDGSDQVHDDTYPIYENPVVNEEFLESTKVSVVEECQKDLETYPEVYIINEDSKKSQTQLSSKSNSNDTVIYNDLAGIDGEKCADESAEDTLYCSKKRTASIEETTVSGETAVRALHRESLGKKQNGLEDSCDQNEQSHPPSVELEAATSDVTLKTEEVERSLRNELLSDSDEGIGDEEPYPVEGETLDTMVQDCELQEMAANTSQNIKTQGQGDILLSLNDAPAIDDTDKELKSPKIGEIPDVTQPAPLEHEVTPKLPKTLGHVSEVPRGIFESILYKLYNRINHRLPRTRRDPSRGPCVKQLVKVFSKEDLDSPKFPRTLSLQVQRTQEEIPKTELFESHSEINDQRNESVTDISTDDETFMSDDFPVRSSTPSQEIVVMEIRDELQKADCSRKKVIELIKRFGGKGCYRKRKKNEMKLMPNEIASAEESVPKDAEADNINSTRADISADDKTDKETVSETDNPCSKKDSYAWLTNVSVKNLAAIFSDFGRTNSPSPKKEVTIPRKGLLKQDPSKPSRTMETQTTASEPVSSCSNLLLLVQPENRQNKMFGDRLERKRSTLSVCLPAADNQDHPLGQEQTAADQLRACSSATALLLVSAAEPVRVHALCSADENCAALTQLAQLLQLPERRSRAQSAARDNSRVRQMVARWDQPQQATSAEL